jgi:hypothetical protein
MQMADMAYEYQTYEEAIRDVDAMAAQVILENPEVSEDDAKHELATSFLYMCPPEVQHDIARSYLGWDPVGDADLYDTYQIPKERPG